MTTILFIRHGETAYVAKGIMSARMPGVPLNEKGRQQAAAVAEALASAPIKAIYSSPMERALETASYLAAKLDLPVQTAAGIIETDIGSWTGRSVKQVQRTKLWQLVTNQPSLVQFPGGESFVDIQQRAAAELKAIAARHPDELVACFSHGDPIRLAVAYFLDMPVDAFQRLGSDTCSVTMLNFEKDGKVRVPKVNLSAGALWPDGQK